MSFLTGQCLCGDITYKIENPHKSPSSCHCTQCQSWGGQAWPSVSCDIDNFCLVQGEYTLTWFQSSKRARRGFCSSCGSTLFWQANHGENANTYMSISMGSLDTPHNMKIARHIYCADQGTYYDIKDGLPQFEKSSSS
ncbi:MAG: aldehyde-activating protein [Robiginitomaculum sp.]|nr:MAG: aldehyde-activating protein [Robiginitomaculum sp.]